MPSGLQLGIEKIPIDAHLETPSIGRHQGQRIDLEFEFLEQVSRQTGSPIGVMSNSAIDQLDLHHNSHLPSYSGV